MNDEAVADVPSEQGALDSAEDLAGLPGCVDVSTLKPAGEEEKEEDLRPPSPCNAEVYVDIDEPEMVEDAGRKVAKLTAVDSEADAGGGNGNGSSVVEMLMSIDTFSVADEETAPKSPNRTAGDGSAAGSALPEDEDKFDCPCCCETKAQSLGRHTIACAGIPRHVVCVECMRKFLEERIKAADIDGLACMMCGSDAKLFPEEVESCFADAENGPDVLAKYRRFRAMASDPTLRECPGCGELTAAERGEDGRIIIQMKCSSCAAEFCYHHSWAHKHETSCRAYNRRLTRESWTNRQRYGTKLCPGCGWQTQKNGGCPHMRCIKCRCDWCWKCGGRMNRLGKHTCSPLRVLQHNLVILLRPPQCSRRGAAAVATFPIRLLGWMWYIVARVFLYYLVCAALAAAIFFAGLIFCQWRTPRKRRSVMRCVESASRLVAKTTEAIWALLSFIVGCVLFVIGFLTAGTLCCEWCISTPKGQKPIFEEFARAPFKAPLWSPIADIDV